MHLFWRGSGSVNFFGPNSDPGDALIYYGSFDGEDWSTKQLPLPTIPNAVSAWGPGMVEWQEDLWVGWRGDQARDDRPEDTKLYFAKMDAEGRWEALDLLDDPLARSAFAPALTTTYEGQRLWIFWRGPFDRGKGVDDQKIYSASFPAFSQP